MKQLSSDLAELEAAEAVEVEAAEADLLTE
jgi:hypothetical protein